MNMQVDRRVELLFIYTDRPPDRWIAPSWENACKMLSEGIIV